MDLKPIDRVSFEAGELIREHPPQLYNANKQLVFEIACSSGYPCLSAVCQQRRFLSKKLATAPELLRFFSLTICRRS